MTNWITEARLAHQDALASKPLCFVCDKPHSDHGSYPTCATHPYSPDGRCGHVGTFADGRFTGLSCIGAACKNGCARASGVKACVSFDECAHGSQLQCMKAGCRNAGVTAVPLQPKAPTYWCNKCGAKAAASAHNRPDGTICSYLAVTLGVKASDGQTFPQHPPMGGKSTS